MSVDVVDVEDGVGVDDVVASELGVLTPTVRVTVVVIVVVFVDVDFGVVAELEDVVNALEELLEIALGVVTVVAMGLGIGLGMELELALAETVLELLGVVLDVEAVGVAVLLFKIVVELITGRTEEAELELLGIAAMEEELVEIIGTGEEAAEDAEEYGVDDEEESEDSDVGDGRGGAGGEDAEIDAAELLEDGETREGTAAGGVTDAVALEVRAGGSRRVS